MATLTKEQWAQAGLGYLKEKGSSDLSIVKLSQKLGVTRGSFYYHFKGLNDLIDAMVATWEENVINKGFQQTLVDSKDPKQEVKNLIEYVTHLTDRLDLVFRQWAPTNSHVKKHMERLDTKRLKTLEGLFQRLAQNKKKGSVLSRIAFFGYIGCLHSYPVPSAQQQRESALEVLEMIMSYLENAK
jgi:AcrR family transcriptional regulator